MILFLIGPAIIHACDIIDTSHFLLIHVYVLLYYGVNVCVYVLWVFYLKQIYLLINVDILNNSANRVFDLLDSTSSGITRILVC